MPPLQIACSYVIRHAIAEHMLECLRSFDIAPALAYHYRKLHLVIQPAGDVCIQPDITLWRIDCMRRLGEKLRHFRQGYLAGLAGHSFLDVIHIVAANTKNVT